MAAQIGAYLKFLSQALAGLITFSTMPVNVVSATASTIIRYGRAVGVTAASSDVVSEGLGNDFMGISVRNSATVNTDIATESAQYEIEQTVGIMQAGNMWADVDVNTVIDGDPVWFDDVTGIFMASGGVGQTQINNARFVGTTQNGLHQVLLEGITQTTAGV